MTVRSAQELLRLHGIDYVATKHGKFTTNCPDCSGGYLNVKIENDKVVWFCHSCDQGGSEKYEIPDAPSSDLGPIKAVYDYRDESGTLLFQALRFEPLNQPKQFRQRTGPDQKKWSIKDVRIVPFRLPELIEAVENDRVVFVVEGEKDVLTLVAHGFDATCNPMGAGKWRAAFGKFFEDADVVICGDNDQPGRDHVLKVARSLQPVARCLRVLDLKTIWPSIGESDDISDWFATGGTSEALFDAIGQVEPFIDHGGDQPPWEPPAKSNGTGNGHDHHTEVPSLLPLRAYIYRPFTEIPKRQWLHAGHYVRGHVVMTIAPGGYGKSSLLLCNALEMVLGRGLIGPSPQEAINVAYWNGEEPKPEEVELRIAALCTVHGINPRDLEGKLFLGQKIITDDWRYASTSRNGGIVKNEKLIKATIEFISDNHIACLMLDPMVNFHRVSEVDTGGMEVLVKEVFYGIAGTTNTCIELSHHTRKGSGTYEITVDDSRGAGAAANACRSARVINRMSREEALAAGIAVDLRSLHLRVHRDKQNMAPPGKAKWIKLANIHVDNDDFAQAAVSWDWPNEAVDIATESKHYLRAEVTRNPYRSDPRSDDWVGYEIGRHLGLVARKSEGQKDDRRKITAIVNALLAQKVFGVERIKDKQRKNKEFVIAGAWNGEGEDLRQSELFASGAD